MSLYIDVMNRVPSVVQSIDDCDRLHITLVGHLLEIRVVHDIFGIPHLNTDEVVVVVYISIQNRATERVPLPPRLGVLELIKSQLVRQDNH